MREHGILKRVLLIYEEIILRIRANQARYTPQLVEWFCGVSRERFLKSAETFCSASGPEKTGAICYALGWRSTATILICCSDAETKP
jgi:hypothetical protein